MKNSIKFEMNISKISECKWWKVKSKISSNIYILYQKLSGTKIRVYVSKREEPSSNPVGIWNFSTSKSSEVIELQLTCKHALIYYINVVNFNCILLFNLQILFYKKFVIWFSEKLTQSNVT